MAVASVLAAERNGDGGCSGSKVGNGGAWSSASGEGEASASKSVTGIEDDGVIARSRRGGTCETEGFKWTFIMACVPSPAVSCLE